MRKYKLLIVDDEEFVREALAFNFRLENYDVLVAASGAEAWGLMQELQIDFVITDIYMKDGSGIELLSKMKSLHFDRPHIILMSGAKNISKDEILKMGALDLLCKPLDMTLLENYVSASYRLKAS